MRQFFSDFFAMLLRRKVFIGLVLLIVALAWAYYEISRRHAPATSDTSGAPLRESSATPAADAPLAAGRAYCFVYAHAATTDAPYTVEEHLALTRVRGDVTGTKRGMQTGPDLTNGYEGTERGVWNDGHTGAGGRLELVYDYVVEGSHQRELELYSFAGSGLVKLRYPLIEGAKDNAPILIPDESKAPALLSYAAEPCPAPPAQ